MKCIIDRRNICFPLETKDQTLTEIEKSFKIHDSHVTKSLCEIILLNLSQTTYQFFIDLFLKFKNTFTVAIKT